MLVLAACDSTLPEGQTEFTVGNTTVRTDSMLDVTGILFRLSDSITVPPRGPARRWLQALTPQLGESVFTAARALGRVPTSLILETWAVPDAPDTACGLLAAGERRCLTGNGPMKARVRSFFTAAAAFAPRAVAAGLDDVNAEARHRDLEDVYTALTASKSLDSMVMAYTGYADLTFDVTLARTITTGSTTAALDPTAPRGPAWRIFITPDAVYPQRSFRSPTYIWMALGHQMVHAGIRRLLAEHPELADRTIRLRPAVEGEMANSGYTTTLWDEALGEQLARAITVRMLSAGSPSLGWALRSEQLGANMAIVPWLEDLLSNYEEHRDQYRTLSDFAGPLADALERIPVDSCRAAPFPEVALVAVDRHRAVAGWIGAESPFRTRGLRVGDTVVAINGDSVSSGGLLMPSRQVNQSIGQNLPFELGILTIVRGGRDYDVTVPIQWTMRPIVRVASANRDSAAAAMGERGTCRWVRRVVRR